MTSTLKVAFFDIGGTLGTVDATTFKLTLFVDSKALLDIFKRILGLRLGIISNTPQNFTQAHFTRMLEDAGVARFFDSRCLIASSIVGTDKSHQEIFKLAARQANVDIKQCLYIGESPDELRVATQAGMAGLLKPIP